MQYISKKAALGFFSWQIFYTMAATEMKALMLLISFSIVAPVITSVLMIMVFSLVLPKDVAYEINGIPFIIFIVPGLMMMNITQAAFSQSAFGLVGRRMFGNLTELLLTPMNSLEFVAAQLVTGIIRGFILGLVTLLTCSAFCREFYNPSALDDTLLCYDCVYFNEFGWAYLWDFFSKMGAFGNLYQLCFIAIIVFVGGFYAIASLPAPLQKISFYNPIFHLIDGLRYGFTNIHEASSLLLGNVIIWGLIIALFAANMFLASYWL